jgi:hypothetical protein
LLGLTGEFIDAHIMARRLAQPLPERTIIIANAAATILIRRVTKDGIDRARRQYWRRAFFINRVLTPAL